MFLLRNVLALCLVALLFAAPVRAQDAKPAAALFSQDTFLYLELDTRAFDQGVRQLDLAKMLADPKLRDLFGPLLDNVGANVEDPIAALLQHVPARAWVDGKIAIGVRGFNLTLKKADGTLERHFVGPGNPLKATHLHRLIGAGILNASRGAAGISISPDMMIVVSPGVNSKQMIPALLAAPPIPLEQSDVEIAGRMVKRVKLPDMNGLMGADVFIDMTGERWIISSNETSLQTALDGSMRSPLDQWAPFREARERFTAENNVVFAYADVSAVVDMVRNLVPPILLESARLQGLDSIRGVCFGMSMTEGGIRESIGVTLKGETTGWFKLLDAFPGGMAGLHAAPAKTAGYIGARFDAKLFVERLEEVLAEVYPGSESVLQLGFSRVKLQTGFDIKQEILDALGDEATILVYPPRGFLPVPDWTDSLAVRDQEKFKALLEKLKGMAAALGVPLQPIQLDDGSEAMQILLPPTIPMLPPVLTLHGDRLLISSADDILMRSTHKAAEGEEPLPRLASGEVFQKVMRGLSKGDDNSLVMLAYLDNKAMVPPLLERVRALGSLMQGLPIDLAKLNPKAFAPHLSGMAIALRRDTKAISIDVFSPTGWIVPAIGLGVMRVQDQRRTIRAIEEEIVMPPMPVRDAEEPFVGFNWDTEDEGVLLTSVIEGTPAHAAGLQVGDRIVGFNDAVVADVETFREQIMKHKAGDTVTLKIKRAGDEMAIVLKLGRRGDHVK